jgi:hypothetical protein
MGCKADSMMRRHYKAIRKRLETLIVDCRSPVVGTQGESANPSVIAVSEFAILGRAGLPLCSEQ